MLRSPPANRAAAETDRPTVIRPSFYRILRCLSAGFPLDVSRSSGMFGSGRSAAEPVEMPVVAGDPCRALTGTRARSSARTRTVIRPTFYNGPFVAGQLRDSGLVSWMRAAAGHGVTALGLASGCGSGERDEHGTGIEGGRGRRRSWRDRTPTVIRPSPYTRACGVWVDTFLRAVWTRF